jgi:hypothetical protein
MMQFPESSEIWDIISGAMDTSWDEYNIPIDKRSLRGYFECILEAYNNKLRELNGT